VDREAVLPCDLSGLVRFVDLLNGDCFDLGDNVMLAASRSSPCMLRMPSKTDLDEGVKHIV
jgi:hypothetical protein